MLQTATVNFNSPLHSNLANFHPSNINSVHGKVISRSPTAPLLDQRNMSPNKLNATKKPMIGTGNSGNNPLDDFVSRGRNGCHSPNNKLNKNNLQHFQSSKGGNKKPTQINRTNFCIKHFNIAAEYIAQVQNCDMGYCRKCAVQLASNGIAVIPKSDQQPPNLNPNLSHLPGYSQLKKLIQIVQQTYSSYLSQKNRYQTIQQHYQKQSSLTQQYYNYLLNLITQIKNDHLADIKQHSQKQYQQALIRQMYLQIDINEIEVIRFDLLQYADNILTDFHSAQVQEKFGFYRQHVYKYKGKIQDQIHLYQGIIIDQNQIDLLDKLKKIEVYLGQVWNQKTNKNNNNQFYQALPQPLPQPLSQALPQPLPQPLPQALSQVQLQHQQNYVFRQQQQKQKPIPVRSAMQNLNIQQKVSVQPKKNAYRQLFDDDENLLVEAGRQQFNLNDTFNNEKVAEQKSPQFKNI